MTRPIFAFQWTAKPSIFNADHMDGEIDRILFEDESMIRDDQAIGRTWFPKGQQKKIPTHGKHWGDKLWGTLDYETGDVFCEHAEHDTTMEFLDLLKTVVARCAGENMVMVLDNAAIPNATLIQPFLCASLVPLSPRVHPFTPSIRKGLKA